MRRREVDLGSVQKPGTRRGMACFLAGRELAQKCAAWAMVAAAYSALSACAAVYTDATGGRRVIGLVDLRIPPSGSVDSAGEVVDVRGLGIGALVGAETAAISVGYHRHLVFSVKNDTLIIGRPEAPAPFASSSGL